MLSLKSRNATKILVALGLPRLLAASWDLLIVEALVLPRFRSVSRERLGSDIRQFDLPGCFARFRNQVLIDRTKVIRFQKNTTINLLPGKNKTAEIASWIISSARSAHPEIETSVSISIPKKIDIILHSSFVVFVVLIICRFCRLPS